jgi:glycosyltransferase involved in cell wall biosynthesis
MAYVPSPVEPTLRSSVIVPVRNGLHFLTTLLEALEGQTIPRDEYEVVIVDDGSADPPVELATPDDHVRVLTGPAWNSYAARNRGASVARGKILAFCDADCVPELGWLEHGMAAVGSGGIVAGRVKFSVPAERTIWTLIDMDTTKNQELLVSMGLAETANLFVARPDFDRVGGFDAIATSFGDYDFIQRAHQAGIPLRFESDAVVWHPTRDHARQVLRAQWVYCYSYAFRRAFRRKLGTGLRIRSWIPIVSSVRNRRSVGLQPTLATSWLAQNGVRPTRREQVLSLPLLYVGVPLFRNVAQMVGAFAGYRARRRIERVEGRLGGP